MADAAVLSSIQDGVGVAELNRPDKFNCLSSVLIAGLDEALTRFERDRRVRAVLIRARGKNFCTGADLDEVLTVRQDKKALATFIANGHRMLRRFEESRLPVVAAVQGLCLAGGLELMMSCDVVFAAQSARVGCQHARYGLVPGWGGTQRLPRLVGIRRALEIMYSGRWLTAAEAREVGLVNHIAADDALAQSAESYCADLARKSGEGLAMMKRLARSGADMGLGDGLALEQGAVVDALMGRDVSVGLAAFQARREPKFQ
jgi:enoyl-CoA hydratase/carnithine racemase